MKNIDYFFATMFLLIGAITFLLVGAILGGMIATSCSDNISISKE